MSVRTLIVDDSPTMQALIRRELAADPAIEVIGVAANANEARARIKADDPDVVTLDIEMPGMDGIAFLDRLMRLRPTPVVMLSSLTVKNAAISLTALELGAFDFFDKARLRARGGMPSDAAREPDLAQLVRAASLARSGQATPPRPILGQPMAVPYQPRPGSMIALGASTGGVETLIALLGQFPANCPPTLIVQHMPASFTRSFAARLDRKCAPSVEQARAGAMLAAGRVYLAPGGDHHLEVGGIVPGRHCRLIEGAKVGGHRPSVDRLFHSVARVAGGAATGAILTGMGADGAAGLKAMRAAGATTIGQDEATSVVYGMPAVAQQIGAVSEQLPLDRIAARLLAECEA